MNEITEMLLPIGVLATIATGIGYFLKTVTNYRLKKKLIERNLVNSEAVDLFKEQTDNRYSSLKWGLIVFFAGTGLIIMHSLEYYRDSPLPFGIFAVSISLGFLVYFFLVGKISKD